MHAEMPDRDTERAYAANAREFASQYNSIGVPFLSRIRELSSRVGRLLDVGCGSGRDLVAFEADGWDIVGLEPVEAMREEALRAFPSLKGKLYAGSLPDQIPGKLGTFDAVHCSAVLMHLSEEEQFNTVFTIRDLLNPHGIVHFSFCPNRPGLDRNLRDRSGRIFYPVDPQRWKAILHRAGFEILSEEENGDSLGRPDLKWVSLIAQRDDRFVERPLLKVEQIINHDTKDATYKLALLRALGDLARSRFHEAFWHGDGRVSISAEAIVDKWIEYYWPVMESGKFIPQKNGEKQNCTKPIAFRRELEGIIARFRDQGSYAAYLDAKLRTPHIDASLRSKVRQTIKEGPVTFSSGDLFGWMGKGRHGRIWIPESLWQELGEMAGWIEPAIRLRWAEETRRFSKGQWDVGDLLSILSRDYLEERNVSRARMVYLEEKDRNGLNCTWSRKPLKENLDVDHIIPFVLWRSNDLWNLVPASPKANNQKRDKLVARDFLFHRRDDIIHHWELLRTAYPDGFDLELRNLLGKKPDSRNWKSPAFQRLSESIESTALRRQVKRWAC
jgi:SAM-dependent methyltransferase